MSSLFIKILNLSFTASFLIVACILVRFLFKKMPKYMRLILWLLVAVRLLVPFSIESAFSLQPKKEIVAESTKVVVQTGTTNVLVYMDVLAIIWLVGVAAFIIYAFAMYLRLRYCVRDAVQKSKDIYLTERIVSPFVLGIFRTKIYMPFNLTEKEQFFVTSHERAHIARKDHLVKPAAFAVAAIYWFNPLVWVAYVLLCRDIEYACDEKVIKRIGYNMKKEYSQSILDLSMPRRYISACPVAFGETGVKERVRNILTMKKTKKIVLVTAVLAVVAVGIGFMTYPKKGSQEEKATEAAKVTTEEITTEEVAANTETDKTEAEKTDSENSGKDSEKSSEVSNSEDTDVEKIDSDYISVIPSEDGNVYVLSYEDGSWKASDNAEGINIVSSDGKTTVYLKDGGEVVLTADVYGNASVTSSYTEGGTVEIPGEEAEVQPDCSEDAENENGIVVYEAEDGAIVAEPEEAAEEEE